MRATSPDTVWLLSKSGKVIVKTPGQLYDVTGLFPTSLAISTYGVWALDSQGRIYYREGVTKSTPQGRSWIQSNMRMDDVKEIIPGPDNTVLST